MILLDGPSPTLDQLAAIADGGEAVGVAPSARARVEAARIVVDRTVQGAEGRDRKRVPQSSQVKNFLFSN